MRDNSELDIERMIKARTIKDDRRVLAMSIHRKLQEMDGMCDELRSLMVKGYNEYPGEFNDMSVDFADLDRSLAKLIVTVSEKF